MTTPPRKRKKAKSKRSGKSRYANMPDTPILRKPAAERAKPMVLYVVFDCDGDVLTTQVTRTSADLDAKFGHPLYAPYRVVRFVESRAVSK